MTLDTMVPGPRASDARVGVWEREELECFECDPSAARTKKLASRGREIA